MISAVDRAGNGMNSIYEDIISSTENATNSMSKSFKKTQETQAAAMAPVDTVTQAGAIGQPAAANPQDRAAKDALIDQMLNQSAGNTPENIAKLKETLSRMPTEVLKYCADFGVNISVVPKGASIDSGLPGNAKLDKVEGAQARNAVRDTKGKDYDRLDKINKKTGDKVKAFDPRDYYKDKAVGGKQTKPGKDSPKEYSVEQLAKMHGNKNPEDIKKFKEKVHGLNGGKLKKQQEEKAAQMKKEGKDVKDLDKIPINMIDKPVLVPNSHKYTNKAGETKEVGGDTRRKLQEFDKPVKQGFHAAANDSNIKGAYFFDDNAKTIVLREEYLTEGTPIHEMGHAFEHALERTNPQLFQQHMQMRDALYDKFKKAGSGFITNYASTMPEEFMAESMEAYFTNPEELYRKSPEAYQMIESMIRGVAAAPIAA
jgi:hypothetical protein